MLPSFDGKKLIYILITGILILLFSFLIHLTFPYFKALFSFLWRVLLPFFIAAFIAYLLFPIVSFLDRQKIHKGLAVMIIYILFFGGIGFLFYHVYPLVIRQMKDLIENLPQFMEMYDDSINYIYRYTSFLPETIHLRISELIVGLEGSLDRILTKLVDGFLHIFDMIIIITVIPVLVFYYIKDYKLLKTIVKRFIPHRFHGRVQRMIHAVDEGLGGYIRGTFIVSLFVATMTFLVFKWLDVPYALLLSIIIGLTNIIPYFGPIIGAIPAVVIAYATSPTLVLFVVITIFAVQIIEGNFLSPYIIGKNINIHPIAIIFALLLGGELFGILGMIFAVPILAIVKVVALHVPYLIRTD